MLEWENRLVDACSKGDSSTAHKLLKRYVDPNSRDANGICALSKAAKGQVRGENHVSLYVCQIKGLYIMLESKGLQIYLLSLNNVFMFHDIYMTVDLDFMGTKYCCWGYRGLYMYVHIQSIILSVAQIKQHRAGLFNIYAKSIIYHVS